MPQPIAPVPQAPAQASPGGPVAPPVTTGAVPTPQTPVAPVPAQLPPPISSVADGSLAALRFPAEPKNRFLSPLSMWVAQNLDSVARAGMDFLETKGKESIIFNPVKTSKEAIL